jgi:hypothetical protein
MTDPRLLGLTICWCAGFTKVAAPLPEVLGPKRVNTHRTPAAACGGADFARHGIRFCAFPQPGHACWCCIAALLSEVLPSCLNGSMQRKRSVYLRAFEILMSLEVFGSVSERLCRDEPVSSPRDRSSWESTDAGVRAHPK